MRQEALILKINGIAVISSMMLTVVSVALFHNLTMAVFLSYSFTQADAFWQSIISKSCFP